MAVSGGNDPVWSEIDTCRFCRRVDLCFGPDEHRDDKASLRSLYRTGERVTVTRVNHGAGNRRQALAGTQ